MTAANQDHVGIAFSHANGAARKEFMTAFLQTDGTASYGLVSQFLEMVWAGDLHTSLAVACVDKALQTAPSLILDADVNTTICYACGLEDCADAEANRDLFSVLLRRVPEAKNVAQKSLRYIAAKADEALTGKMGQTLKGMAVFLRDGVADPQIFRFAKDRTRSALSSIREPALRCVQIFYEKDASGVSAEELKAVTRQAIDKFVLPEGEIAYATAVAILRGHHEQAYPENSIVDGAYIQMLRAEAKNHAGRKGKEADNVALSLLRETVAARPSLESVAFPEDFLRKAVAAYNLPVSEKAEPAAKPSGDQSFMKRLYSLVKGRGGYAKTL